MSHVEEIHRVLSLPDLVGVRVGAHVPCPDPGCPGHGKSKARCQIKSKTWTCYYCEAHGDIFGWVMARHGCDFKEALNTLADYVGLSMKPDPERSEWLEAVVGAAARYLLAHESKLSYLTSTRALPKGLVFREQLGYIDPGGEVLRASGLSGRQLLQLGLLKPPFEGQTKYYSLLQNRFIFPVRNVHGEVVSLKGRWDPSCGEEIGRAHV